MDIHQLKERILNSKSKTLTEEATKTALVMPFIQYLGYDVFNPEEVIPEFVADISTKKGEKVDYCIQKDGEPIIIIECKHWKDSLTLHNTQLERYFNFTKAKFGILTNGVRYRFYTDLDELNKLDSKPFLEFDFENLREPAIIELKKFQKSAFDVDKIIDSAGELKYTTEVKQLFEKEMREPSEDFVKHFANQVYPGKRLVSKVVEQFAAIVRTAASQVITEKVNERLNAALQTEKAQEFGQTQEPVEEKEPHEIIVYEDEKKGVVTTQEEVNSFEIVVDILKDHVDVDKIAHRDTKNYMGVLYDDNNRQPICRLWFNRSNKYIGLFDEDKNEEKIQIEKIEHIYMYANKIIQTAKFYQQLEQE